MDLAPARVGVAAQTAAAATSPVISWVIPGLEGAVFYAWGGDSGAVSVGRAEVRRAPAPARAAAAPPAPPPLTARAATPQAADGDAASFRTLLTTWVLDEAGAAVAEPVVRLAFGGGPHVLLAAASAGGRLAALSLEALVAGAFRADAPAAGPGAGPRGSEERVHVAAASLAAGGGGSGDVLALSWTQQLDGVLVSTACGALTMWALRPDAVAGDAPHAALRRAWRAQAPEPQDVLSAGVGVGAPSASAAAAGERGASVWWPQVDDNAAAPAAANGAPAGATRERLKHPCRVAALEWCPGVLRRDALAAGAGGADEGGGGGAAAEDHPALMTAGADGGVRLWVEMLVVLHAAAAPAPPHARGGASPPASPQERPQLDSYFAMALVVEPPRGDFAADGAGGARLVARWARPAGSVLGRPGARGAGAALWLLTAQAPPLGGGGADDAAWTLRLHAVRGLSAVVVASFAGHAGGAGGHAAGGRRAQAVLWGEAAWRPGAAAAGAEFSAWVTAEDCAPLAHVAWAACEPAALLFGGARVAALADADAGTPTAAAAARRLAPAAAWAARAPAHAAPVTALAAGAGPWVASADASGALAVWRGAELAPADTRSRAGALAALCWAPGAEGRHALLAAPRGDGGALAIAVDAQSGALLAEEALAAHLDARPHGGLLCLELGGRRVAAAVAADGGLTVFDGAGSAATRVALPAAVGEVAAAAAAPGGLLLAGADGAVHYVCLEARPAPRARAASALRLPGGAAAAVLAVDAESGLAAAAAGEALVIWEPGFGGAADAAHASSSGDSGTTTEVEASAVVALGFAAAAAVWVPGLAAPCVAVGGAAGRVEFFAPARGAGWHRLAALTAGPGLGTVAALALAPGGAVLAAAGPRVLALGRDAAAADGRAAPLARLVLDAAGPLLPYHPAALRAALLAGRGAAAAAALRALAAWLPQLLEHRRAVRLHLAALHPFGAAGAAGGDDALAGGAPPASPSALSGSSEALFSPRVGGGDAPAPPPYPGATLAAFLPDAAAAGAPARLREAADAAAAAPRAQQQQQQQAADALSSGQLDMAAFGMGGGGFDEPPLPPPPMASGLLDMAAFGMEAPAPAAPAPAAPLADSGLLDMATFGMAMKPPSPPAQQQQVASGALDMAAFGLDLPAAPAPPPAAAPAAEKAAGNAASALSTPAQAAVPAAELRPVAAEVAAALRALLSGAAAAAAADPLAEFDRSTRVPGGGAAAQAAAARTPPAEALPGLSLEETGELLVVAERFSASSDAAGNATGAVDEAGRQFLWALELACAAPLHPGEVPLDAAEPPAAAGAPAPLSPARSSGAVVNAAGVSLTFALAPGASSGSAAGSDAATDDKGHSFAAAWGLAPGLGAGAVLAALLSGADAAALLERALGALRARAAAARAALRAAAAAGTAAGAPRSFVGLAPEPPADALHWPLLRAAGAGFWLRDAALLRPTAEALARAQFAARRRPEDAALLYCALGKRALLASLCRTAGDAAVAEFLGRDFSQAKHRAAAAKNAFVLLGQHRPALAAAFFALARQPADAVGVCARELGDVQMALLVARLLGAPEEERAVVRRELERAAAGAARDAPRAAAACRWLLGDASGSLAALLAPGGDSAAAAAGLLPTVALLSRARGAAAGPLSADDLLARLRRRCLAASRALQAAGVPSLALGLELVAQRCGGDAAADATRAARVAAAALLADDAAGGGAAPPAAALEALRAGGLALDVAAAARLLKGLRRAALPAAAPPLERRASLDTQRSDGSSLGRWPSFDARAASGAAAAAGRVLGPPLPVFSVEGDSVHAIATCALLSPDVPGRPVVAAAARHGLVEGAEAPPPPPSPPAPAGAGASGGAAAPAGAFSRLVAHLFDGAAWAADPLDRHASAVDGDWAMAAAAALGSSSGSARGSGAAAGTLRRAAPAPGAVRTPSLRAHPSRPLLLSGCDSGRVLLWEFGGPRALASFTPVTAADLAAAQPDRWDGGLFSFAAPSLGRAPSVAARLGNWGGARGLAWSASGERFAAVGAGGVAALWRLSPGPGPPADSDGALCAEWWASCDLREGAAVEFVGGGSSVLAVGGRSAAGDHVGLWDSAAPPDAARVGALRHHRDAVLCLRALPGGWLLAAGDAAGALSLTDVRMLGGGAGAGGARVLWSVRAAKGAVRHLTALPLGGAVRPRAAALGAAGDVALVSGGADGVVRVWDAAAGRLLQSVELAPAAGAPGGGRRSLGGRDAGVAALDVCDEGVLACGGGGAVHLLPLLESE
jgi:hypothetical protein